MRQRIIAALTSFTFLLCAAFLLAPAVQAQGKCNLQTVKGTFGFLNTALAFGTPLAGVGVLTLDGAGRLSGHGYTSFGGVISDDTLTGTYTVNADCTGTLAVTFPSMFTVTSNMAIADNGKEAFLIFTVPGEVGTGTMRRVALGTCNAQTIKGSYANSLSGTVFAVPYADVGVFKFDGANNWSFTGTSSFGGTILTESSTGTYEVNSDCTGTATLAGGIGALGFVIFDNGKEAWVLETDPMTILPGTLKRQ